MLILRTLCFTSFWRFLLPSHEKMFPSSRPCICVSCHRRQSECGVLLFASCFCEWGAGSHAADKVFWSMDECTSSEFAHLARLYESERRCSALSHEWHIPGTLLLIWDTIGQQTIVKTVKTVLLIGHCYSRHCMLHKQVCVARALLVVRAAILIPRSFPLFSFL